MSGQRSTLCFQCGLPIADPPRFNHLSNGRPCPTCRDRLLDSLPPLLPGLEPEPELDEGQIEDFLPEENRPAPRRRKRRRSDPGMAQDED